MMDSPQLLRKVTQASYSSQRSQQGVALIFVLLMVAVLVGIAATMTERMFSHFYRSSNLLNAQQAYWYAIGAESLAQVAIEITYEENDTNINLNQAWAMDVYYPVDNGEIRGIIKDKQACFNVNALAYVSTKSSTRPYLLKVLSYMLTESGVDNYQADTIADSIKEFVDEDTDVATQNGVEDLMYESFTPPYVTPNTLLADNSELRAVNSMTGNAMLAIEPLTCALPSGDLLINVNTLQADQALLLASLFHPALSLNDAVDVINERPPEGWNDVNDFLNTTQIRSVSPDIRAQASPFLTVKSRYFELDVQIKVDNARTRLRSLIYSADNKTTQVIRRRLGGISERISDNQAEQ